MSDIQDPLIVLQNRMQQRQILALMGINQWVQPRSETLSIADISAPALPDAVTANASIVASHSNATASTTSTEQPSIESSNIASSNIESPNINAISDMLDDESNHSYDDANETGLSHSDPQSPVTYHFDSTAPVISNAVTSLVNTVVQQTAFGDINNAASCEDGSFKNSGFNREGFQEESFKKVAPFDLQGGRYGDWVILVDIQALNNDSQKLWQNITQALSISCETTSFPICEGMDTAELANASLAGYVFKIGRREEIKVAALTVLPDGLEHPNFTTVPTLDEMLKDSKLKRQLWEQLSK